MDDVYRAFVRSADLATWSQCLDVYERRLDAGLGSPGELARGACVCTYVSWLASCHGELAVQEAALRTQRRFASAIGAVTRNDDSAEARLADAVGLASAGYVRAAAELLGPSADLPAEIALLVMSTDPAERSAEIRAQGLERRQQAFAPAFYFYCQALLDLGRISEVEALLPADAATTVDPFIADLVGGVQERQGRWAAAAQTYRRSSWPRHKWRASVCAAASGDAAGVVRELQASLEDAAMRRALSDFEGEVDQRELARTTAFVTACRWNGIGGWMIDFELGKLAFRRRRHWDADEYLRAAEASCPPRALFELRSLRFLNLTWLSSQSGAESQPMLPEATEAGFAALESALPSDRREEILVWMADEVHDRALLAPVFASDDPYYVARAHQIAGNRLDEIAALVACIDRSCAPRALHRLISWLSSVRFVESADYLTRVALGESEASFFDTWELGTTLLDAGDSVDSNSAASVRSRERLAAVSERLQRLSQFEFQHLMRAFEFFSKQRRDDLAELMLARAARLAEGSEENLAIAIARRPGGRYGSADGVEQGLASLAKAARAATHRVERLHVAAEYCAYGHLQKGRQMLEAEHVFDRDATLGDVEYIAALLCAKRLDRRDFDTVAQLAFSAAIRNIGAGVRRRFEPLFRRRLLKTISDVDNAFAEHLVNQLGSSRVRLTSQRVDEAETEASDPSQKEAKEAPPSRESLAAFKKRLAAATADRTIAPLVIWSQLLGELQTREYLSRAAGTSSKGGEVPIARTGAASGPRPVELRGLWHAHLHAQSDEARRSTLDAIRRFEAEEDQRLADWKHRTRASAAEQLQQTDALYDKGLAVLELLKRRPQLGYGSRVVRTLEACLASDATTLTDDLKRSQAWTRERLREDVAEGPRRTGA